MWWAAWMCKLKQVESKFYNERWNYEMLMHMLGIFNIHIVINGN